MKQDFVLYPFAAIVGQEKLKRALLVNAVDPRIGGLLIRGERGTGKSTAARALADILLDIEVVADCPFSCNPHNEDEMCESCLSRSRSGDPLAVAIRPMRLVTLPLNASEDRVVGTLDLEKAVKEGVKEFEPGVLAEANRSILYVDEVNLLDDHIVDVLLDAAAMGVNIVEREGVSFSHPSSFILIGTMNPEEGELRPQLEDRFGLCVEISGEKETAARMEVVRRRQRFLENPHLLQAEFASRQEELRLRVSAARGNLHCLHVADEMLELISRIAVELGVCGHRADIAICQAARALAALDGSPRITVHHVREAAEMALLHRLRKTPFDDQIKDLERLDRIIERGGKGLDLPIEDASPRMEPGRPCPLPSAAETPRPEMAGEERLAEASEREIEIPALKGPPLKAAKPASGRRSSSVTETAGGRRIGHRLPRPDEALEAGNVALDATLRAAAGRTAGSDQPYNVRKEDLRAAVRRRKAGNLVLFVLDASASMGCRERIESTKKVMDMLLMDAYQKRDRVGLITFRDETAQEVLAPTSSVQVAQMRIKDLATGGTTPLNHGLALAYQVSRREKRRDPDTQPLLVLITDGQGNVGYASANPLQESLAIAMKIREEGFPCIVFDTSGEISTPKAGKVAPAMARRIANAMGADYHHLAHLQPKAMMESLEKRLRY